MGFFPANQQPSCGVGYASTEATLHGSFSVGASQCGCECEVVGASCPTSATLQIWDDAGCLGTPDHTIALSSNNACFSITSNLPLVLTDENSPSNPLANDWFSMAEVPIQGGICQGTLEPKIGDAGFGLTYVLCGPGTTPQPCAVSDGVCVPVPSSPLEPGVCIWRSGDSECPSGGYGKKTLLHGGHEDDRSCSTCDCGSPQGTCSATIALDEYNDGEHCRRLRR